MRLYAKRNTDARRPVSVLAARSQFLSDTLYRLRKRENVAAEGTGTDRQYTPAREPAYYGNPDAVDETGTKAAEHMAIADALRTVEKMLARGNPERKSGPAIAGGRKDYAAVALLVGTLRAKSG